MERFRHLGSGVEDIPEFSSEDVEEEVLRSRQYDGDLPITMVGEWPSIDDGPLDPFDEVHGG